MITESIKLKRFIDLLDKMYNYSVEFPDQHLFQLFSQTLTNVSKDLYNFYIAHGKSDTDVRNHIKDVYNNVMQKYNEGYVPFEDLITFD